MKAPEEERILKISKELSRIDGQQRHTVVLSGVTLLLSELDSRLVSSAGDL
jgi:hypothetical protein